MSNGNTTAEQIAIVALNPWVMVTIYSRAENYSSNIQWVMENKNVYFIQLHDSYGNQIFKG